MSTREELTASIAVKGEEIRALKAIKPAPATFKTDLEPLVNDLKALKLKFKEVTGEDFDPPKEEKPKAAAGAAPATEREGPSKSELNKQKRKDAAAAAKAAAKEAKGESTPSPAPTAGNAEDDAAFAHLYGDYPVIQSTHMTERVFKDVSELNASSIGQTIWVRGRLANSRAVGKGIFLVLRQHLSTAQAVMFQGSEVPKSMIKYAQGISLESCLDVCASVCAPAVPIESVSIKHLELQIKEIHVVSRAQELPFMIDDAGRNEEEANKTGMPTVLQETSLNFRWIDTRTPANQAIFRIQSGVCQLFREYLIQNRFIEIHTPKLIGGASEGGSNVFTLKYFDQPACLAQSPQLYKQMVAACGGFDRVFEIGPVFRAENSNTHRHLCEFTGLDFEMTIIEHYYECLQVMGELFAYIFDGIADRFHHELQTISLQYPFEPLKYCRPALRITFQEGITLLREAGFDASYDEDISTPHEKALGKLIRDQYETDFYIMDKYPSSVRPFYTMADPHDPTLSNSYDLFIRGEEIVSGAQRIHDVNMLIASAQAKGIPVSTIQSYVDAFKHGALPHAGGGIGLERVVMLYLGLKNIRKTSMFPRDPSRLTP